MDPLATARLFVEIGRLRRRERRPRHRLLELQARRLAETRSHALKASPFYRRFHGAAADGPYDRLPVLTKGAAMDAFDELVTDPRVRLADVRRHADRLDPHPYLGRFLIVETSGSTGQPGVFVLDPAAWLSVLASISRSREWAGGMLRPWKRTRTASVTMNHPAAISFQLATSMRSWWVPLLALDAAQPRAEIVQQLNAWQPEMLVVYASAGRQLAEEQLQGRLAIKPRLTFTTAEVQTPETRRLMAQAFGSAPFNRYSTTETGDLAAECAEGRRMHLFEDTAMVEVVDADNRPVPLGEWGTRVLVTPFHNRLQPLIRYELSDQIRLSDEPCPCGRAFLTVDGIHGRVEEQFRLPALRGTGIVDVHGLVLETPVESLPVSGFQLIQAGDALTIRLERYRGELSDAAIIERVEDTLREQGARASRITIERVEEIPRGPGNKAPRMTRVSTTDAGATPGAGDAPDVDDEPGAGDSPPAA